MVEEKPSNRGKIAAKACALLLFGLLLVSDYILALFWYLNSDTLKLCH